LRHLPGTLDGEAEKLVQEVKLKLPMGKARWNIVDVKFALVPENAKILRHRPVLGFSLSNKRIYGFCLLKRRFKYGKNGSTHANTDPPL
jgi:hypothetical protein